VRAIFGGVNRDLVFCVSRLDETFLRPSVGNEPSDISLCRTGQFAH
jgi:hypothetical protein